MQSAKERHSDHVFRYNVINQPLLRIPGELMTGQVDHSQDNDTCRKLITLGYARSNRVRLYGSEVELVSDPFPHREGGIAVEVVEGQSPARTVKLPLSVVQVARSTPEKRTA